MHLFMGFKTRNNKTIFKIVTLRNVLDCILKLYQN